MMFARTIPFILYFSAIADSIANFCPTLERELKRRQSIEFGEEDPYDTPSKHTPFIEVDGSEAVVTVGSEEYTFHPMVDSSDPADVHWINYIYVVDQNGDIIKSVTLGPEETKAEMRFTIPNGVESITAYEFCNKHGLWKGPTVNLVATSDDMSEEVCALNPPHDLAWDSLHADFLRRQSLPPFNSADPFTDDTNPKHIPYVTVVDDMKGSVIVGVEGNYHPMSPTAPHWITDIYVVDQDNKIIAFHTLDPSAEAAEIDFNIPASATELTAYEWCNLHGLWKGPTVTISTSSSTFASSWMAIGITFGTGLIVLLF